VSISQLTDRQAVELALNEYDTSGQPAFLSKYGFSASTRYLLVARGKEYDSKAVAGAAHGYQFPELGPLSPADFSGGVGSNGAVTILKRMGFLIRDLMDDDHRAWIFQANPKFYDVRAASRELERDEWSVNQYRKEVQVGDRV